MVQALSLCPWQIAQPSETCHLNMVQHVQSSQLMKKHFDTCVLQDAVMIKLHSLSTMQRLKECGMTHLYLLVFLSILNSIYRLWSHLLQGLSVRKIASHLLLPNLPLKRFFLPTSLTRQVKRRIQSRWEERRQPLKMVMLLSHLLLHAPTHQTHQS